MADSGWNATDGISATGMLATVKKLTVTATESLRLVAGGATVSNDVEYRGHVQRKGRDKTWTETTRWPAPNATYKGVTQQYAKAFARK